MKAILIGLLVSAMLTLFGSTGVLTAGDEWPGGSSRLIYLAGDEWPGGS